MKSIKMLMMAALTIVSVSLFAQDSLKQNAKEPTQKSEQLKYSCPMKCEGDKTYEKSGKCPKCNMNLKEVASASDVFVCPMKCEGDKTYVKPGNCPKCGMQLVEKSIDSASHNMKMMHPMMMGGMNGSNHKKKIPLTIIMGAMMIVVMFISKSR